MAVNTAALDDGKYNTGSSFSGVGSRTTLKTQDVVATSTLSVGGTITQTAGVFLAPDGTALAPGDAFTSEASLGFYRSASSIIAQSYGTYQTAVTGGIGFNKLALLIGGSSSTTAASGATAKLGDGQLYFSVLSLTSNGGEFGFRSGNTTYRFSSTLVG